LDPNPKKRSRSITRLYQRRKGHTNPRFRKETKAPNQFTEATLLRAMETAGKQVDDEDLRELMKENGIDVRQHERILLKRYLNVNTSLEIKNRCYQRRRFS
jgi:trimethylamine:corrinoid methyltransferase-like protein